MYSKDKNSKISTISIGTRGGIYINNGIIIDNGVNSGKGENTRVIEYYKRLLARGLNDMDIYDKDWDNVLKKYINKEFNIKSIQKIHRENRLYLEKIEGGQKEDSQGGIRIKDYLKIYSEKVAVYLPLTKLGLIDCDLLESINKQDIVYKK